VRQADPEEAAVGDRESGHRTSVLILVFGVVLLQVAISAVLDRRLCDFESVHRNPNYMRLWPEYVRSAPSRRNGETLVVVISHSQGYGPELSDDEIFPARLEARLAARSPRPVRVVNWSVPSGNAREAIILAAAAHRLRPDVTLMVTGPRAFLAGYWMRQGEATRLDRSPTDVRRLIGFEDVRRHLPDSFRSHYLRLHDHLDAGIARIVPLWSYRDVAQDVFQTGPLRPFAGKDRQRVWSAPPHRPGRIPELPVRPLSPELIGETVDALASLPGRRLFVQAPVHSRSRQYRGFAKARRRFEAAGVETFDLSARIPDEDFLSAVHMDAEGHARITDLLLSILAS
jgi:hypothetical protein